MNYKNSEKKKLASDHLKKLKKFDWSKWHLNKCNLKINVNSNKQLKKYNNKLLPIFNRDSILNK